MDIDYLKDIGKIDTFPINVDSSERNKVAFPYSAEYEVVFDEPFKYVVGFDVLDSTIANTMYSVDVNNNILAFVVRTGGIASDDNTTIDEYFSDLSQDPTFEEIWNDKSYSALFMKIPGTLLSIDDIYAVDQSTGEFENIVMNPLPDTKVILSDRDLPIGQIGTAFVENLGIDPLIVDTGTSYYIYQDMTDMLYYVINNNSEDKTPYVLPTFEVLRDDIKFLLAATYVEDLQVKLAYATITPDRLLNSSISKESTMTYPTIENGRMTKLMSYGITRVTDAYYDTITSYFHELEFVNMNIEIGNHDIDSFVDTVQRLMPTYVIDGTDGTETALINLSSTVTNPNDYRLQRKIKFASVFRFWFDMGKSTVSDIMGFSEIAFNNTSDYTPYRIGDNLRVFDATATEGENYILITPGLVNMTNERLVVLRCPQIEEHAFPSYSHSKFGAGLGIFKLYDTTYAHLRFDFNKIARLDFHPIGKLSKLTLRFETLAGDRYDFKGVDHHIFMLIKFLSPRNERSLPPPMSRLNPDYDPNTVRYIVNRGKDLSESSTDSDRELLEDKSHQRRYLQRRGRFLREQEMKKGLTYDDVVRNQTAFQLSDDVMHALEEGESSDTNNQESESETNTESSEVYYTSSDENSSF
ncbi:hypothetical protein TetV_121 [Tetraselmis virus 1]|uniref:DUF5901 domain-containing protein n=1 Tax=Tetraselmis virus 1 TaxID=2060617 RepID=A0A2P0VMV6_9VIRU|nr:hypothetical protein QJ968_gp121 [Tetraselmis virus 1]AUF82213.1 hypothetical protein TetV_121 [Tetraselmis virus 1]